MANVHHHEHTYRQSDNVLEFGSGSVPQPRVEADANFQKVF